MNLWSPGQSNLSAPVQDAEVKRRERRTGVPRIVDLVFLVARPVNVGYHAASRFVLAEIVFAAEADVVLDVFLPPRVRVRGELDGTTG